jgi:arylsulfatase A-like enzyme
MTVLARVLALFLALGMLLSSTAPEPADAKKKKKKRDPRPNILIVMTDDQRRDTLEVMPAVRHWFQEHGRTFPNTYNATPLCCPDRATVMTGRYAHNHRVVDLQSHHSLDHTTTLQYLLGRAGYRTAIVGKYFNGWPYGMDPPFFDRWAILRGGYFDRKFAVDGKKKVIHRYTTDYLAARSKFYLRKFERKDNKPWLMYVTPTAPHEPFSPAVRHASAPVPEWEPGPNVGEVDKTDKPPYVQDAGGTEEGGEHLRREQLRTLMAVDEMVDRVIRALGELRERRRTLVIFTSDNGFFWAEHGLGDKRLPYEEGNQIPLLMRWPGRVKKGGVDRRMASAADIAPTVLEAAGVAPSFAPIDGRSLLGPDVRSRLFMEYFVDSVAPAIPPWASTRTKDVWYTEYYADDGSVEFREYYDLEEDPYQLRNLLGDADPTNDPPQDELDDLEAQLAHDRTCSGTTGPTACP